MAGAATDAEEGAVGVHSLDHFAFCVPDLAAARAFYTAFGLDVREEGEGLTLRTFGSEHVWVRLSEGPRKQLRHISFGAYAADLPAFETRLRRQGVQPAPAPVGFEGDGLWFFDCAGVLLQVRAAPKSSPDEKRPAIPPAPFSTDRACPYRDGRPAVRPIGLSHALFFQPDIDQAIEFYSRILGLRLSDHGGPVAFLHGVHGSEHHLIAFAASNGAGYHHSAWAVTSIEEIGLGAAQMAEAGYQRGWGLGRHVLGSNYFHYVRDPWGSYAEYSFDIDYIPRGHDWVGGRPDPENSFYLWGPTPPEDFTHNHEVLPG